MATSGKVVEVLCPTGRRQKVKTNPSMTVLQILQQVCEKQGYKDDEFDLKHQRKILNVTSMMRFLNLPNNAKLELVKCEKARPVSMVTVALQLEEGARCQGDFNPETTLLDILRKFVTDIDSTGRQANQQPVCVYMRNEYKGMDILSRTTLKNIGIITGRAAIRLLFRDIQEELNEPTAVIKDDKKIATSSEFEEATSLEPNGKKMKLGAPRLQSSNMTSSNIPQPSAIGSSGYAASSEGNAYTSMSIIGPPPRQIFPDDDEKMICKDDDKIVQPNDTLPNNFPNNFSNNFTNRNEFANFKFPENCGVDDSEPVPAIDPKQMRREVKLGMPCDRKAILFSLESVASTHDDDGESYEPDDQFFQVTIDDLRKRLSDLKSDKKGTEDALLLTSAMREQKRLEKVSNFELIPVRFMLPEMIVLQGIFRPLETIGALNEFLSEFLLSGIRSPQLFITPPKVVLKNKNETLFDAKLFPAAVVHTSFNNISGPFLKEEYVHKLSTSDEAEAIVDEILKRKHVGNNSDVTRIETTNGAARGSGVSSSLPSSSAASNRSAQSSSFQENPRPKGAPKWFKTGR